MMPSMTAMPNSPTKPIAADTLNGVPVTASAKTPPVKAIGSARAASDISMSDRKLATATAE